MYFVPQWYVELTECSDMASSSGTHLPLGLLKARAQLGLLALDGGASFLEQLALLQQLREVLLQLLLLLLQLVDLELQHLLAALGLLLRLLHLVGAGLTQLLHLLLATLLFLLIHLHTHTQTVLWLDVLLIIFIILKYFSTFRYTNMYHFRAILQRYRHLTFDF